MKKYKLIVFIFFLLCIFTFFSHIVVSTATNRDVHIKSIIPSGYILKKFNMEFKNYSFPNGSLYQVSNNPSLFRNVLVVINENISEMESIYSLLLENPVTNLKTYQLRNVEYYLSLSNTQFYLTNLLYSDRWSFFLFSYLEPPYEKPNHLFGTTESEWTIFDQGWYYINEETKTVIIWTVYSQDTQTLQKIGNRLLDTIFEFFPYQESIYLEKTQYLRDNIYFSINVANDLESKDKESLSQIVQDIDGKIIECMNRKSLYYDNFESLAFNIDPVYYSYNFRTFGFINPMISDLNVDASSALQKNDENIANLLQSKNVIQNELSNKMTDDTLNIAIITMILTWIIIGVDIAFNIPKICGILKWWKHIPKLDFHVKSYTRENGKLKQTGLTLRLNEEGVEEYTLKVNDNPILGFEIRHVGKYLSYYIRTVEVLAPKECDIEYCEVFAIKGERPFISGYYTDIWYNMKIFLNMRIVKNQISDPTLLGFKLNYMFKKDEKKKFTVKIRTSDCTKMFEKSFILIGK